MDLTLAEPQDVVQVTPQNCYNSSDIGFELVFTTAALSSDASVAISNPSIVALFTVAVLTVATLLL